MRSLVYSYTIYKVLGYLLRAISSCLFCSLYHIACFIKKSFRFGTSYLYVHWVVTTFMENLGTHNGRWPSVQSSITTSANVWAASGEKCFPRAFETAFSWVLQLLPERETNISPTTPICAVSIVYENEVNDVQSFKVEFHLLWTAHEHLCSPCFRSVFAGLAAWLPKYPLLSVLGSLKMFYALFWIILEWS